MHNYGRSGKRDMKVKKTRKKKNKSKQIVKTLQENDEGELSLRLHNEAQKLTLANVARKLHLYDFLKTQTGINFVQNDNIMADVVESLLGAIFLDGGLDEANKFLLNFWPLSNDRVDARKKDAKTLLQDWCLKNG